MVQALSDVTFNCITVDSDTSTSDSLLVAATGASGVHITGADDQFRAELHDVMRDLAHQVVRDGEGASKFVEIKVSGAANTSDAHIHAMAIANSPLVKTAIAGEDPNWGRVVMAIGKSGAAAERDLLTIQFGDILVAENGWVAPDYDEDQAAAYMTAAELRITVDLGLGAGNAVVWTCDLTHRYVEINADYRS
jgi:glutamate N-acetyltransferase/amino-acid N-acetyltransferase